MNKQRFLKFIISEIERQQKDMYKSEEGKKVVAVLTEIYTLVSDRKFDVASNRGEEISEEIKRVAIHDSKNYNKGQFLGPGNKLQIGPTGSYPRKKVNNGEVHHEVQS